MKQPPSTPFINDKNIFELYLDYVEDTEAPIQFHRWSLIAAVGATLGRNFWLPFGTSRIFPNQYIMLVGSPGTRKSTAIKGVKKILARSGYDTFGADKTTKEKFLLDLEGLPETYGADYAGTGNSRRGRGGGNETTSPYDVLKNLTFEDNTPILDRVPREVFVCADEFNEFTGSGNLDFFSLLGALWDWDDENGTYTYRLKNSKSLSIYQPTISILGGNTHTSIQSGFPGESIGQGFMSRLLFIHGEPSGKKISFPKTPPEELGERISRYFTEIRQEVNGPATLLPAAERALDTIYRTWQELEDYRFRHYSTRRFTHLLKLVLVCAASRKSKVIDIPDVLLANTFLTHAEHYMSKALGEYGKSRNSEVAQMIMTKLYEAKKPLNHAEIYKLVRRDLDKKETMTEILISLQQAGKIQWNQESGGFLPIQKPISSRVLYVDLKLLRENR